MIVFKASSPQSPDVSIIIPTYNRIAMLEEALRSVLSQKFDGSVEILIVDDHSKDGTSDRIRQEHDAVEVIQLNENIGNYAARNVGLARARGKYIAFLDDDDLWEPAYLQTQLGAFQGNERTFCVSGLVIWDVKKDRKTFIAQDPDLKRFTSPIHQLMIQNFIYTPSSIVFPRAVFGDIGNFDETMRMGGDADLYIRCLLSGIHPTFTRLPLAVWRVHREGKLTDVNNFKRANQIRRIEKYYDQLKTSCDVPIQRVYAELDSHVATRYLFERHFFNWMLFSLRCGFRGYPGLMFKNMARDIKNGFRAILPGNDTNGL